MAEMQVMPYERANCELNPLCDGLYGNRCEEDMVLCLKAEDETTCTGDGGAPIFGYSKSERSPVQIGVLGTGVIINNGGSYTAGTLRPRAPAMVVLQSLATASPR